MRGHLDVSGLRLFIEVGSMYENGLLARSRRLDAQGEKEYVYVLTDAGRELLALQPPRPPTLQIAVPN
jgi:hypothetical protein